MSTDANGPDGPDDLPPDENGTPGNGAELPPQGKLIELSIEQELKESYLTYAMSVIVSRALPDVRDGLKPSQRRILVAMNDLNLTPGASRVKCAKISGDTSGNYHPHGESVIYPTLVRMAQEWNMRYVLIDKQGNFGSIAGLPPAAMRYTEARMSPYRGADARRSEARHRRFHSHLRRAPHRADGPALEVSQSAGQRLQRHRRRHGHQHSAAQLGRSLRCLVRVIDEPDVSIDRTDGNLPRPRFSHRRHHLGRSGIRRGYHTGRGTITLRARAQDRRTRQRPLPHRRQRNALISRPATRSRKKSPS